MKNVLIVGTGTIGSVLIGMFARYKNDLGIDNVLFHKNTPLKHDMPMVKEFIKLGAVLSTDEDKFDKFKEFGVVPKYTREGAIKNSSVIIDCTPKGVGVKNKLSFYDKYNNGSRLFVAQGSEHDFGKIFAKGINNNAINKDDKFIQVASCNTHSIAVLIKTLGNLGKVISSKFVCIRRSNDISQKSGMSPSVEVGKHNSRFGTHHAEDVHSLFETIGEDLDIYSSACKINTQYMHTIHFDIKLRAEGNLDSGNVINIFNDNKYVSMTEKVTANKVFSFFRDFGIYGRTLTQTVISIPTIQVRKTGADLFEISGFSYTPQDSNSLLTSSAIMLWFLNDMEWDKVDDKLSCFSPYLFQEL